MRKLIYLFLLVTLVAGCHHSTKVTDLKSITTFTAILKTTLNSLNLESPENDLNENIENQDYRFIGICSYACYAPGLESFDNIDLDLLDKYGLRNLEGTSDAIEGDEHMELIKIATAYATAYNQILLNKIKNNEIP